MSDEPIIAILNGINDRVGRVLDGQAESEVHQIDLERIVFALQQEQISLRTDMTTLRVDLMARMDRLEDQITLIREDITVNIGASDSVRTANEGTKAELRALSGMVFTMTRQIRRLQTQVDELSGKPSAP